jgi:hypothetical protein
MFHGEILGSEGTPAMTAPAKHSLDFVIGSLLSRAVSLATLLLLALPLLTVNAQSTGGFASTSDPPSSVHGTVLNRITHEPITRALVYSPDQQYATLTDDRGHFEFKFPPQEPPPQENSSASNQVRSFDARRFQSFVRLRPTEFLARKPGFLESTNNPANHRMAQNQSEITLYLDPESLIVGRLNIPGAEGDLRIRLEIYRREVNEGQEHWISAGTFNTLTDGEFRFSNLSKGIYKLFTHEQLDRDPLTAAPAGQLFGFPPVFYPSSADFSAASPIQLAPGATFQANLSVTRREYYPVKIPVANAAAGFALNIRVYPLGHPGPGYSLGYNQAEEQIIGSLPDGSYTLEADTNPNPNPGLNAQSGGTGILNFSVHGGALESPPLALVPNSALSVNVREQLSSGQSAFDDGPEEAAGEGTDGTQLRRIRYANVYVTLTPLDDFGGNGARTSQRMEGTREHALVIPNVRPGRYHVHVESGVGYVASILSGGKDLLREPFEVGLGGSSPPIEVTLRDDGAEVTGSVEDPTKSNYVQSQSDNARSESYVYFLPLDGSSGQFRERTTAPDGTFSEEQLPPGSYLVVAFEQQHNDLVSTTQETLRKLEPQGQVIQVNAGQKERLRLKLLAKADSQ